MAEKKLSFTAEEIDELLRKVDEGELGGASPEQIQQIQKNKDDIDALKAGKLDVEDVADWAKQPQKPEYTPEEIGAQPKGSYITTESDPTVPNWAKSPTKPSYTATEIGAEPANAVSAHNTSSDSHGDIRLLITELTTRLNTLANSTDTDLDQMAELVAYIKANRGLIEQVTSGKVSVTDIVNNLTTNVSNKPLSAAQGVTLKGLIDTLQTAVNAAAKATDLATHTGNTTIHITAAERSAWNKKQDPQTTLAGYGITDGATKAEVSQLSEEIADLQGGIVSVPDYWVSELEAKADAIQIAMEKAGRNKSAFLWYTDAHWVNGNSKKSPMILDYMYRNTPMNKTNFGGDIIGDTLLATREEMKYLYEWRRMTRDIRNHHSVFGNHDMFDLDSVDYENDNYRYAFLLAPEETPDMVWGDGNYYYIDNPAEKTRYLHLAYLASGHTAMMAQGQWIVDAIKSVPEGWHIVAISHRWWQYSKSSTPTTGSIPAYEAEILDVFDKYNARATRSGSNYFTAQDFTGGNGKVEFCIGGHIHVDYDFFTAGGIPIIITTADANQNRVPDSTVDSGTEGTITESAVFGIIADYNEDVTKITVVGIGRGTSRVVRASTVTPKSISNISYSGDTTVESAIDKTKFSFMVNYSDGSTSSVTGASTVSPATIGAVGDNAVTITYIENGVTLTGTVTIVGTAKPVANLFDKNDADVVLTGRINSSGQAVAYQEGQLVTGWFEGKVGDTFTIASDKAQNTNGYTGTMLCCKADKSKIATFIVGSTGDGGWIWDADHLSGTITIPSSYSNVSFTDTAWVRFCIAYTDIDSIVITKK